MGEEFVINLGQDALKTTLFLASPILIIAMVVGIGVSLLQAITQINEATLTFVPKMLAIAVVLVVGGPWMLETLVHYTSDLFIQMPNLIR